MTKATMTDGDGHSVRSMTVDYFRLTPGTVEPVDSWRSKADGTFYSVSSTHEGWALTPEEFAASVECNGWAQQYVHFHVKNFLYCIDCFGDGTTARRTRDGRLLRSNCKHCNGEGQRYVSEFDYWDVSRIDTVAQRWEAVSA